jgi:predicted acylesterase/phospholipase RssA
MQGRRIWFVTLLVLAAGLAACGTIPRSEFTPAALTAAPAVQELDRYRIVATDDARFLAWMEEWTAERRARGLDGVKALALSGGGANGSYGAGVLVGWSETGARPRFDFVTGVSTGALIAPLAFAGPDWDPRLTAAYHDTRTRRLTEGRLSVLRHPSLYNGAALNRLVETYVDAELLRAIAVEHASGRRLMVATTNLDAQQAILWDMGAIATLAQAPGQDARALRLFRKILVASASIPGVFPPVLLPAGEDGGMTEMHVDGGVTTPFFLIPEVMAFWRPEPVMRPTDLFVIINGQVGPSFQVTPGRAAPIMMRALDTMGRADARAQITVIQAFATRNGATLGYAAIPDTVEADPLRFDVANMTRLFDLGRDRARQAQAFVTPPTPDAAAPAPYTDGQ